MPDHQDQRIRALFADLSERGPVTPELIRKVERMRRLVQAARRAESVIVQRVEVVR